MSISQQLAYASIFLFIVIISIIIIDSLRTDSDNSNDITTNSKIGIIFSRFQNVDINEEDLIKYTNNERAKSNLLPLKRNELLDQAASLKIEDMFTKNYWAHNAPDGTTPWTFINKVGYAYSYSGENLARDFTSSRDVIDSWMGSQKHKENILFPNYTEVGFAIKHATLNGLDTMLVVQMFGAPPQQIKIVDTGNPSNNSGNNNLTIDLNNIKQYRDNIVKVRASWATNNDRYPKEDIDKILDSFNRQIDFCNTIISNVESKKGSNADNLSLWNMVIGMGNETAAITARLNGK